MQAGNEKSEVDVKPEELESAEMELVLFAQRYIHYITNYANYIQRRISKTGITLPFENANFVSERGDDIVVTAEVRIVIPRSIVRQYAQLKKQRKVELPKIPYQTLKKVIGAEEAKKGEDEELEMFKKDIYSEKV